MKILIGVMSCWRDRSLGAHKAIRETWMRRMVPGVDVRFFLGVPDVRYSCDLLSQADDEVLLPVDDDYAHLPEKSQQMKAWALVGGYDFMFKADRDTYIIPERLIHNSGFAQHDYIGHFPGCPKQGRVESIPDKHGRHWYASGGCGYWNSRRAMQAIADSPLDEKRLDKDGNPAEDLFVANVLLSQGMQGWHDGRYWFKHNPWPDREVMSIHLSQGTGAFSTEMMRFTHKNFMEHFG
jgi:hypothetical protein